MTKATAGCTDTACELHTQALKLLSHNRSAHTSADCKRATDRAEGFVLGLETAKALNASSIEGLYKAFDDAATARRLEHAQ